MQTSAFRLAADDGVELHVYRWKPDAGASKAVVQIAHGMAEHAGRYARTAEQLTAAGYTVYADDHRGHGRTALAPGDLGYLADHDGFARVSEDLYRLNRRITEDHPDLPLYLLGHSMGSLVTQRYLFTHGESIAGAILSGTGGGTAAAARAGLVIAKVERLRLGPRGRSALLQKLSFGSYNKRFQPARTAFDWLSRDAAEVDKYIADPLCGFDFTVQGWIDVLEGVVEIERAENIARVPFALPIYLFSGALDPVGRETVGVKWWIDAYARAGVKDVSQRFYPGGRHEMLNEENRDEVHRDLIAWLDAALARR